MSDQSTSHPSTPASLVISAHTLATVAANAHHNEPGVTVLPIIMLLSVGTDRAGKGAGRRSG
jgi:hypothetical protein